MRSPGRCSKVVLSRQDGWHGVSSQLKAFIMSLKATGPWILTMVKVTALHRHPAADGADHRETGATVDQCPGGGDRRSVRLTGDSLSLFPCRPQREDSSGALPQTRNADEEEHRLLINAPLFAHDTAPPRHAAFSLSNTIPSTTTTQFSLPSRRQESADVDSATLPAKPAAARNELTTTP